MRVLVVCSGNICRSPMAEGLLRHRLRGDEKERMAVSSAGTLNLEGEPADPDAVAAAAEAGIDISDHRSRGISAAMVREADLILVMTEEHARRVGRMTADPPAIHLLGSYLPATSRAAGGVEIDDPLGQGPAAFRACLRRMERAVEGFLSRWRSGSPRTAPGGEGGAGESQVVEDAEQRYFRRVEERILQARGGGAGLSSMEFHIVDGWWKRHLPLWLVLEALEEAAGSWAPGEAPRGFIRKAEAEVEARTEEAGLAPPASGAQRMEGGAREGRAALERELSASLVRLGGAHPEIESALKGILETLRHARKGAKASPGEILRARERLCQAARASLPMGAMEAIEIEERARLSALAGRLSPEARHHALHRLIEERLLAWFGLPTMNPDTRG